MTVFVADEGLLGLRELVPSNLNSVGIPVVIFQGHY